MNLIVKYLTKYLPSLCRVYLFEFMMMFLIAPDRKKPNHLKTYNLEDFP